MGGWQDYINFLKSGNCCEEAHIYGLTDGGLWASSAGLTQTLTYNIKVEKDSDPNQTEDFTVDERIILLESIGNKGVPKAKSGLRVNNVKYYSVNFDEQRRTWYLKKQGGGACLCFTNKAILFGAWSQDQKQENGVAQNPGDCNKRVEDLAKKLLDANW